MNGPWGGRHAVDLSAVMREDAWRRRVRSRAIQTLNFVSVVILSAGATAALLRLSEGTLLAPDLYALEASVNGFVSGFESDLIALGQVVVAILMWGVAIAGIVALLWALAAVSEGDPSFGAVKTGEDFERYCARQLRAMGWDVDATRGSGEPELSIAEPPNGNSRNSKW